MMIQDLKFFILRDADKLKTEIEQYSDEENLWRTDGEMPNSAGNLCLHLIGNLNHFIGTHMGNSGYIREREKEFTDKNTSRQELIRKIEATKSVVETSLDSVTADQLADDFPLEFFGNKVTVGWVLVHLATHLNYHLGQINYHRRIIDAR